MKTHQDPVLDVFTHLCRTVDTEYSRNLVNFVNRSDWEALFSSRVAPHEYTDSLAFAKDYACANFIRKYERKLSAVDTRKVAISTFKAVEEKNRLTNRRLRHSALAGVESIISIARRKIRMILGRLNVSDLLSSCDWGPGATASLTADEATLDNKCLEPRIGTSRRTVKYIRSFLTCDLAWSSARLGVTLDGPCSFLPTEFSVSESSRFSTVPKDNSTDRVIDIQPTANLFIQKGVGGMIRKRLKRHGIDLDDQSRNQQLAQWAQLCHLATIDLANASNTVSTELVNLLLSDCPEWLEILTDLRTTQTVIDGEVHKLEMFSAMGNGYTFELESLIFYAICLAVEEEAEVNATISVYGDDIVIDQALSEKLIEALEGCGFEVNRRKTFTSGLFFESCGKHYFEGREVTPLFQKEEILDFPSAVRMANRIYRWVSRIAGGKFIDAMYRPVISRAVGHCVSFWWEREIYRERRHVRRYGIRKKFRICPIPLQPFYLDGDDALITWDLSKFNFDIHGSCRIPVMRNQGRKRPGVESALYATSLRRGCVVSSPFNGFVTLRGSRNYTTGFRRFSAEICAVPTWV